jgi:ATP phosphoribosyltransferase
VGEGRIDLGITGRDQVAEHDAQLPRGERSGVEELLDLGFGGCKLQVQVPEKGTLTAATELIGKQVVTSFTALTRAFFAKLEGDGDASRCCRDGVGWKLNTRIKYVGGSVEAACALGVADGIVDLVGMYTPCVFYVPYPGLLHMLISRLFFASESGETMKAAGLKAIDTVLESTAILIKSKNSQNKLVDLILSRIRGVICTLLPLLVV